MNTNVEGQSVSPNDAKPVLAAVKHWTRFGAEQPPKGVLVDVITVWKYQSSGILKDDGWYDEEGKKKGDVDEVAYWSPVNGG